MVSGQALAQPLSRLREIAQALFAAGLGQHLKDAPARTAQRSRDYIDGLRTATTGSLAAVTLPANVAGGTNTA